MQLLFLLTFYQLDCYYSSRMIDVFKPLVLPCSTCNFILVATLCFWFARKLTELNYFQSVVFIFLKFLILKIRVPKTETNMRVIEKTWIGEVTHLLPAKRNIFLLIAGIGQDDTPSSSNFSKSWNCCHQTKNYSISEPFLYYLMMMLLLMMIWLLLMTLALATTTVLIVLCIERWTRHEKDWVSLE